MLSRDNVPASEDRSASRGSRTGDPAANSDADLIQLEAHQALRLILTAAEQGILVHDSHLILVSNRRTAELLDCPPALIRPGAPLAAFIGYAHRRGDYAGNGDLTYEEMLERIKSGEAYETERKVPDGRVLRVDSRAKDGYVITTYTDVTEARLREDQLRRSRAKIHQLAVNDSLTGIFNRRTFDSRLSEILNDHYRGAPHPEWPRPALVAIDLDGFKSVNDTRGHLVGDAVLRIIAERFAETIRRDDTLARLGGDEFAIITLAPSEAAVRTLALRLCAVARQPIRTDGMIVGVGASAGYVAAPERPTPPSDLVSFADLALYSAKRKGGSTAALYSRQMLVESRRRAELVADLRRAVANDEFELHYQVQQSVHSHAVIGYEALLRWNHPSRGLLMPQEFVGLAEETGIIVELGRWALRRATKDFAEADRHLRVAVNVSPKQVTQSDIVSDVRAALHISGLAPARLELEMTEAVLIDDTDRTRDVLDELHSLGVGLALDDFGSGYSSLAYLTLFPFDKIKIDRSFVSRMRDDERSATLVSSILAMAGSLQLKVVAEGVEAPEQLATLARHGCDEAQGYLLGKPQPLDTLRQNGLTRSTMPLPPGRTVAAPRSAAARGAAGYAAAADFAQAPASPPRPDEADPHGAPEGETRALNPPRSGAA